MSKKIIVFSVLVLITVLSFLVLNFRGDNKIIYTDKKSNQIINTNALTMMYETEADSGEYQVSSDTTWPQDGYIFNETLSRCENGGTLTWNSETNKVVMQTNSSDKCYVYFDVYEPPTLAKYIVSQYTTDGENGLYLHDGIGTYGAQEAGDNSYRYSGANPNNYVCFGVTGADCQEADNQYRIIGVFNNQVKLIKATSIGDYAWDSGSSNTWDETTKPDIYTTLNTTYYNTLESEWQNLISESTWQVGGMVLSYTNTAKQYYDVEVGTGQSGYVETMKIGLMYVSDYGYGASPEKWTTALYEDNYGTDNWLYLGDYEWLLSRRSDASVTAFSVYSRDGGHVSGDNVRYAHAVRPSFSLTSTATISSGTGTSTDPFVLNLG